MALIDVYSTVSAGGGISSVHPDAATARGGFSLYADGTSAPGIWCFSGGNYIVYQGFLEFDTSAVLATDTVNSATLSVVPTLSGANADGVVYQARLFDFGASVTTADYRTPTQFAALPLLAHQSHASLTDSVRSDFVSDALASNIVKGGTTRLMLCTALFASAGTPTDATLAFFVGDLSDASTSVRARLRLQVSRFTGFARTPRLTYLRR